MTSQYSPCRDTRPTDERLEAVFEAAGRAIFEFAGPLAKNYADGTLPQAEALAAVGKALVVNGITALAVCVGVTDTDAIALLCDDVTRIVADRLEEHVKRAAA